MVNGFSVWKVWQVYDFVIYLFLLRSVYVYHASEPSLEERESSLIFRSGMHLCWYYMLLGSIFL